MQKLDELHVAGIARDARDQRGVLVILNRRPTEAEIAGIAQLLHRGGPPMQGPTFSLTLALFVGGMIGAICTSVVVWRVFDWQAICEAFALR